MKKLSLFVGSLCAAGAAFLTGYWYSHRQWISDPIIIAATGIQTAHDHSSHSHATPVVVNRTQAVSAAGQSLTGLNGSKLGHRVEASDIVLSLQAQQLSGIRTEAVTEGAQSHKLRLVGRVTVDESRIHRLIAGSDGFISEVSPITTGLRVRQNQQLAVFSSPGLRAPVQGYITTLDAIDHQNQAPTQSQQQTDAAKANYALAVDRLISFGVSPVQIEEIKRTRVYPALYQIRSPVDGFVIKNNVSPGQRFDKGLEWFTIAELNPIWVVADVFEVDAMHVKPGTRARIILPGSNPLAASVSDALPQFDPASRAFKVRLQLTNQGFVLRPDMITEVEIDLRVSAKLTVPSDAVISSGKTHVVYVERQRGVFEQRTVEIGWRLGNQVQIVTGLSAGERVVSAGAFLLDSESRMRLATDQRSGKSAAPNAVINAAPNHDHSSHSH